MVRHPAPSDRTVIHARLTHQSSVSPPAKRPMVPNSASEGLGADLALPNRTCPFSFTSNSDGISHCFFVTLLRLMRHGHETTSAPVRQQQVFHGRLVYTAIIGRDGMVVWWSNIFDGNGWDWRAGNIFVPGREGNAERYSISSRRSAAVHMSSKPSS